MKRMIVGVCVACLTVLNIWGCQAGGWRDVSVTMDGLERDLRKDGLVTIKRPDVWTENRLHTYRSEFEEVFADTEALKGFKPNINATAQQLQTEQLGVLIDAAWKMSAGSSGPKLSQYLATALLGQFDTAEGMSPLDFTNLLQTAVKAYVAKEAGVDPATLLPGEPETYPDAGPDDVPTPDDDTPNDADTTTDGGTPSVTINMPQTNNPPPAGSAPPAAATPAAQGDGEEKAKPQIEFILDAAEILKTMPKAPGIDLISRFEEQAQKRAYVQQNHLFRIGNEPDDGTRMNGYRLYYMRYMVSVTPSGATQSGHSAEILLSPSYNVLDAARDWCAQYARALLRERILRTIDIALDREIQKLFAVKPHKGESGCMGRSEEIDSQDAMPAMALLDSGLPSPLVGQTSDYRTQRDSFGDARQLETLRFRFLTLRGLAQIAYDELAIDIDVRLGTPNSVRVEDQTKHSFHRRRAEVALCEIYTRSRVDSGIVELADLLERWLLLPVKQDNEPQSQTDDRDALNEKIQVKVTNKLLKDAAKRSLLLLPEEDPASRSEFVHIVGRLQTQDGLSDSDNEAVNPAEINVDALIDNALSTLAKLARRSYETRPGGAAALLASDSSISLKGQLMGGACGRATCAQDCSCTCVNSQALRFFFSPKNWPVYTFAVAPFSEVENIARAVQLNGELQFMLNAGLKFADMGEVNGALQYVRALREEFQAIQVNRTVVGLVRGEQHFGWQFNPPYSIPVRRKHSFALGGFDKLIVDEAESQTMPSRTYEVFALVAVPGFLRSMEFTVHSDWTNSNRSDGTRVGTAKAAKYLRRYRWLQKRVGMTWRDGEYARDANGLLDSRFLLHGDEYDWLAPVPGHSNRSFRKTYDDDWGEDNIFLGELLADRLDLPFHALQ